MAIEPRLGQIVLPCRNARGASPLFGRVLLQVMGPRQSPRASSRGQIDQGRQPPLAFALRGAFSAVTYLIDLQRVGGHLRAKDPCSYLGKGNVTGRRAIICEWRKSAIVSGPELFNRDVPCRLQDAISYEFG